MSIVSLSPAQIAGLTAADIESLGADDIADLTRGQVRAFTAAQWSDFSATQIGYFSPDDDIAAIPLPTFAALSPSVIAEFTGDDVAALTGGQMRRLSAAEVQSLQDFTLDDIIDSPIVVISELSASQFSQVADNLYDIGVGRFSTLTTAELSEITADDALLIGVHKIQSLSGQQLAAMAPDALSALWRNVTRAIGSSQLNTMGAAALGALDTAYLTDAQLQSLDAATLASLSTQSFDALFANDVSNISVAAISGVSVADLNSLTAAQLADFTSAQITAMNAEQASVLAGESPILTDLAAHESGGTLSDAGALAVLQDAASGGMTQQKLEALTVAAGELNSGAGPSTSAYVQQMFDNVVLGNSANRYWSGGLGFASSLGDLTESSTQTQMDELIDKWFLGSDLPSPVAGGDSGAYEAYANVPLFGASGSPQIGDVNQGPVGDCYFEASLAEVAYVDPSSIENMIQSIGDDVYSVEFQVDGKPVYETVNDQIFTYSGNAGTWGDIAYDNGDGTLWSEIVEKAFAQLTDQTGLNISSPSAGVSGYNVLNKGGDGWALTYLTGQSVESLSANSSGFDDGLGSVSQAAALGDLQGALAAGEEVLMGAIGPAVPAGSHLVADHMFSVLAVDASAGTVTLRNPWGDGTASGATFTDSISTIASMGVVFEYTSGKSVL